MGNTRQSDVEKLSPNWDGRTYARAVRYISLGFGNPTPDSRLSTPESRRPNPESLHLKSLPSPPPA